jgi:putative transposase
VTTLLDSHVTKYAPLVGMRCACQIFGVHERSRRHRQQCAEGRRRKPSPSSAPPIARKAHPASLTNDEKQRVIDVLCAVENADVSPTQIYWRMIDLDTYLCSIRQMYRLLAERNLTGDRRGRHSRKQSHKKPRLVAKAPNQVWCWDITILRGPTKGVKYYLYTFIDLFSRKIVAWSLHTKESENHVKKIIRETCKANGITREQLTIHADRGSVMIAGSVEELMHDLGVEKSHSRPRVSNDNAFMESHYKTLKYQPTYPERFDSINQARQWCRNFFAWYNGEHYHQGIGYHHPTDVHDGSYKAIDEKRQATLDIASARHPRRFSKRPHPPKVPDEVWINRPVPEIESK